MAAVDFGAFPSRFDAQRAYTGPTGPGGGRRGPLSKAQLQSTDSLAPGCGAGSDSDADLMCIYASSEIAVHIEMGLTSAAVLGRKQRHCDSSRVPKLQPSQPVRLSEKVESTSGSAGVCRALTQAGRLTEAAPTRTRGHCAWYVQVPRINAATGWPAPRRPGGLAA